MGLKSFKERQKRAARGSEIVDQFWQGSTIARKRPLQGIETAGHEKGRSSSHVGFEAPYSKINCSRK